MKIKILLTACLVVLGLSVQAKDYKYQTFNGDLTKTRIYTLDNGLKVYLSVNKPISPYAQVQRTTLRKRQVWHIIWSI